MQADHLVTMANQIGTFFESYPDEMEASTEIANHLKRFWAPSMRSRLLEYIDIERGAGLKPLVLASISANREQLAPAR
ncbi:formate dehydrogenase subunit delta [Pseudoduganella namucuonensis]|uniref:Formate dehydrogenase delta subunit n=1 Tax=Pseudoduganella namucuonensis TaxID=1035707 RepID=A0A1I7M6Y8_9BURK|nr:formate dehydrogenase subunit delta [Pseudoduganella namucuonensis]SFV17711.1 formate dehydrogenase delta subunit [Pseudoduganella namucuonensis]